MKTKPTLYIAFSLMGLLAGSSACTKTSTPASTPSAAAAKSEQPETVWTCTMHPEVRADKPGKCPICHMELVPVKKASEPATSPHPLKTTEGRAAFQLTPEQEALTGAKPIAVEERVLKREIEAPGRVTGNGRVSFQIFEQDVALLKIGQEFVALSPSAPGKILHGKIVALSPILDPMTRTVRVEGTIQGKAADMLRAESTVTGVIEVQTARVITIPEDAVMHTGSADLVFVTDGKGGYQPHAVKLGIKAQNQYEVVEGLKSGTLISSGPNFLLDSESRVRANHSGQSAPSQEMQHHDHSNH